MATKYCPRKDHRLPVSEFNKDRTSRDGLQAWCRKCQHENAKATRKAAKRARKGKPTPAPVPEPERPTQPALVAPAPTPVPNPMAEVLVAIELLQDAINQAGIEATITVGSMPVVPEAFPKPPVLPGTVEEVSDERMAELHEIARFGGPTPDPEPEPEPVPVLLPAAKYRRWVAWRPSDKVRAMIDRIQGQPGYCTNRHEILRLLVQEKHDEIFGDS